MQRLANVLLYSVLGLVLAASLGAVALAASVDPKQFQPTNLSMWQTIEQEAELPPLLADGADELRMWSYQLDYFQSGYPKTASLIRVTPGRIEHLQFAEGSWARRWAVTGYGKVHTPVADGVLRLLNDLRLEPVAPRDCFTQGGGGWIQGRVGGEVFQREDECERPAAEEQMWKLIAGVPAL